MMDKRIPLDFENYPALWELFKADKEQFASIVKGILTTLDHAVSRGDHHTAKYVFNVDYAELNKAVIEALFDYEGIINHHHNEAEKESMKVLKHEMNPLAVFNGDAYALDSKGQRVPRGEWSGAESIKDYFQGLFYGARFVSLKELAQYLSLGQYELVDVLKARNFKELSRLQPALDYQKKQGYVIGKLLPGTGYLDCGEVSENDQCLVCNNRLAEGKEILYCLNCHAGYKML